ncbi:MAG: TlpA family protein disulfide reductase, partial [Oligoflexia bacterium]|nr:TlpA family protein disulfide reductase [Oligoflexia bacterium]
MTTKLLKVFLPVVLVLALTVGGLYAVKTHLRQSEPRHTGGASVGATLPDFALEDLNGQKRNVSRLGSKVLLINFWASWCDACIVEMPSIVELRRAYRDRGFDVVAVNVDENAETVVPVLAKRLGIDFPVYVDRDGSLSELFDVHAIPLTVLIDRDRKVLLIHNGDRDWNAEDI